MVAINKFLPKWTKRVVTETGGRDPLGLSRVVFLISDYLMSGIITTTDRSRYYSFYCWALWHIEREERPSKYQDFVEAFRRREAAMALATLANDPSTSPVGVEATRFYFEKGRETGSFDCDFKVLPSNPLGGYGQYYGGSIYRLKLSHRPGDFIDRVTEGIGEELAEAFHRTVEGTPYIKKGLYKNSEISVKELMNSKEFLTLDSLNKPFALQERKKLIEIFFGLSERSPDEKTVLRRQTLTLILHMISEYEKNGFYVNMENSFSLDEYLLYPMYYGVLWPEDDKVLPYKSPDAFVFCKGMWKQFCLHQFLSQALENLLYSVLEVPAESGGLSLNGIISKLIQPEFFSVLAKVTGSLCTTPHELMLRFRVEQIPDNTWSQALQSRLSPRHKQSEAKLLYLESKTPEGAASQAVLLLAVIYGKWRGISCDSALKYIIESAGNELWAGRVLPYLDNWLNPETTWTEALYELLEPFVLDQHDPHHV